MLRFSCRRIGKSISRSVATAFLFHLLCQFGTTAGTKGLAFLGQLLTGFRRADGPRVQQQHRPLEHVAGELLLVAPFQHVPVLVSQFPPGEVHAGHEARLHALQRHVLNFRQRGVRIELRQIPRGEDMHAGELRVVPQLHVHILGIAGDALDVQRRQPGGLHGPCTAQDVAVVLDACHHSDADAFAGGLQVQVVVAGLQALGHDDAIHDAECGESVCPHRGTLYFKQGQFIACRHLACTQIRHADILAVGHVHQRAIGVVIGGQRPGVAHSAGRGGLHPGDVDQWPEQHPPEFVRLERGLVRELEVLVL